MNVPLDDRAAIVELCTRLHWFIDHGQLDELDGLLDDSVSMPTVADIANDPDFDRVGYLEVAGFRHSREQIKDGISRFTAGMTTQHLIAGHHVFGEQDTATCTAHSINVHIPDGAPSGTILWHGNEYQFDLLRRDGRWRIVGWLSWIRWSAGDESFHNVTNKQQEWLRSQSSEQHPEGDTDHVG